MKVVIIGAVIILAVFLVVLSFIPIGVEPLTELYFNNHTSLPTELKPNETVGFSFTINNLEYKLMSYDYIISAEYNNKSVQLGESAVSLANNQSTAIPIAFSINENFTRAKIVVTIKYNQTIHFWVNQKD
jgi:hypothetical protein